jgi:hypothetical protein
MKFIIIIIALIGTLNIYCVNSGKLNTDIKYITTMDTLVPPGSNGGYNPTNMQPTPPSTVNGNNTPVLPDTNNTRHSGIDTSHMIH